MNSVMRAVDTYSWLNSFAENEEEGNVSSRRSTPSLGPFPIHCISHRIKEGERGRKAETAWLCYASLAIDFKADRPSVLRIKQEENIFIRITRIFVLRPRATTWPVNANHASRDSRITRNEWSFSIQKSYDYNGFLNYRILLPATNIYWN